MNRQCTAFTKEFKLEALKLAEQPKKYQGSASLIYTLEW